MGVNGTCGSLYAEVVMNVESGDASRGDRWDCKLASSDLMFSGVGLREEEGRAIKVCDTRSDIDGAVESGKRDEEEMAVWIVVS